jgi:hypothetical protein
MAWLIALLSALLTVSLLPSAGASSPPVGGPSTTITPVQGAWDGCIRTAWAVGVGSVFDGDDADSAIFVVAVATFSGSRVSTRRAGAAHPIV